MQLLQLEGGCLLVDEGRGDFARVTSEPNGEEDDKRNENRERSEKAQHQAWLPTGNASAAFALR